MTQDSIRQRKEWRRCSDELPEGGWLVINGVGKVMHEDAEGNREPYAGDIAPLLDAGARIRIARIAAGLTQDELARQVGITQGTLWEWESGRRKPTQESVDKVFDQLTPIVAHIGGEPRPGSTPDAFGKPMPRTKANLRRLRDATGVNQTALAVVAGLDPDNPTSVKDVRHWEDPKNHHWAPEVVWQTLECTFADMCDEARHMGQEIIKNNPDRSVPVTLFYYRTQKQYEKDGLKGEYGVYNTMISMVGDVLEFAGYTVEFLYPDESPQGK